MFTIGEKEIIEKCLIDFRDRKNDARNQSVSGLSVEAYRHLCKELDVGEKNLRRHGFYFMEV